MVSKKARIIFAFPLIVLALLFIFSIKVEAADRAEPEKGAGRDRFAIFINGEPLPDAEAFLASNRVLLPLRTVGEVLGAEITWEPTTKKITLSKNDIFIKMYIGGNTAMINERPHIFDVMPKIIDNRTFVPLRFISEALNCDVTYRDENEEYNLKPNEKNIFVDEKTNQDPTQVKKALQNLKLILDSQNPPSEASGKIEALDFAAEYSVFFVFEEDSSYIVYNMYTGDFYFVYDGDFHKAENERDFLEYFNYIVKD